MSAINKPHFMEAFLPVGMPEGDQSLIYDAVSVATQGQSRRGFEEAVSAMARGVMLTAYLDPSGTDARGLSATQVVQILEAVGELPDPVKEGIQLGSRNYLNTIVELGVREINAMQVDEVDTKQSFSPQYIAEASCLSAVIPIVQRVRAIAAGS